MTDIDLTCPRCKPEDRTPSGGSAGYIFWDDATDEEQAAAGQPDGDGEITCPMCEGDAEVPAEIATEMREAAAEKERLRILAENAPAAKFSIVWEDDDNAKVIAMMTATGHTIQIGLLNFDKIGWWFVKFDRDGTQLDALTIPCDPDTERAFKLEHESILTDADTQAVEDAKLKALATRLALYRDDSRDIAELGARIEARKWWREFSSQGNPVT